MIPKIIHYVWLGSKELPEPLNSFVEGWRRLHPDFDVIRWDESNLDLSQPYFKKAMSCGAYNCVANYVRLSAVRDHGGIYLDTDVELLKALHPLLDNDFFCAFTSSEIVGNAVFAAKARHPFFEEACERFQDFVQGSVTGKKGPRYFTYLLNEKIAPKYSPQGFESDGIRIYPPRYFYPFHWKTDYSEDCVCDDTYGIHHWAATWTVQFRPKAVEKEVQQAIEWVRRDRYNVDEAFFPLDDLIKDLRARNEVLEENLKALKSSLSWSITRPMRSVKRQISRVKRFF